MSQEPQEPKEPQEPQEGAGSQASQIPQTPQAPQEQQSPQASYFSADSNYNPQGYGYMHDSRGSAQGYNQQSGYGYVPNGSPFGYAGPSAGFGGVSGGAPGAVPGGMPNGGVPNAYATASGWAAPTQNRKSHGWIVGIVIIVALCLVTLFGMWSCSNAFSSAGTYSESDADLLTNDAIGVITIDGTIQYDGTTCSPEGLKEQLDIAAENDYIKAVVLRVNSGGGVATAGEEMTEYVREFKESSGKPVVVSSAATNASAAYELSSQADYIYVGKTTAIGAIGTAMQFMDYSGLMEMLGITTDDITSSSSKDSTYGNRALTEEERAYYQAQVDQINETFIENVAQGRNMTVDEVRPLATGLTFTGLDAVENGLADEVGTREDAVAKAAELAGCSTSETVTLDTSSSDDLDLLLDLMAQSNTRSVDELAQALKNLESESSIKQ